ncbi:sirtuin 7 isoform X1 [Rhynchophorus ferrugineus]|uniref:sirtuin 7 isoform X1 n=1 Tax=Rhynchophorus ferrugineus TaxID=354439 RepID=UPI003FCC833C
MDDMDCEDIAENESAERENTASKRIRLLRPQSVQPKKLCAKEERTANLRKVSMILQKSEHSRTTADLKTLERCSNIIEEVQGRLKKREALKKRLEEFEDPEDVLTEKCQILAQAIAQSQHLVVYTGAGISTAAKIPDYRGPNGIWTRLKEGKEIEDHDLSLAEPTYTHMALFELYRQKILKYVVSQNCDGLHLRSGLPRTALSELHGNMYIEVCKTCKPHREYWRAFDVTENTARYAHKTYRRCYACNGPLQDTIVHFGERGSLQWPLNWKGACKNAKEATTIICLGSSLKVLKKYPWLWQMNKPAKKRPNLYIVNLQWTPKDECANVKINGRCDVVFRKIMAMLGISVPRYNKCSDPIFQHSTALTELELHTTNQPVLNLEGDGKVKSEELSRAEVQKDCFSDSSDLNFHCDTNSDNKKTLLSDVSLFVFSRYTELFLYPHQTSFLYPGLHSIIDPLPAIKEETFVKVEADAFVGEPACNFCHRNYKSVSCLFYKKADPTFSHQKWRYSKIEKRDKPNVCLCCDYTTEEEDEAEFNANSSSDREASSSSCDKEQKVRVQAGWFGKGYRKRRRFKRKMAEYK